MIPPRPASAESMRTRPPAAAERDGTLHAMFRWFDNPFPADAEPQRLLALATTRRRLIEEGLGLTGDDADLAAFGPAAAFMAKLADATITPARRHLCALGLFLTGRHTEATDALLAGFADAPAPAANLSALRLVLPLPRRLRRSAATDDPAPLLDWLRRHHRELRWDAAADRYTL